MVRLVAGIVGGLAVAFAIVFASDALFHVLTASGATMPDTGDRSAWRAYMDGLPMGALLQVLAGWTLAALAGAWVAARFGGRGAWPGWLVGGVFLLATAANFATVPHPAWMVGAAVVLILFAAWLGAKLPGRARPA